MTTEPKGLTDAECDAILEDLFAKNLVNEHILEPHAYALIRAAYAVGAASVPREVERWINLCRGYRKMVNAVAPHFDKPLDDENVVLWMNLNNAGATIDEAIAMYDAAREGK